MKEKTEHVTLRLPQSLDKEILCFARKHFNGDYSKAVRYLCKTGLIVAKRLEKEDIM